MPLLKTIEIVGLKEYIAFIEKLRVKSKDPLWYRGCGKFQYKLMPSLYRHKEHAHIDHFMSLEKNLMERFKQRSIPFHNRISANDWEWLFLMQHYGVPTRLLDWSESPLVALFFAVTSANYMLDNKGQPSFANDASIWLLNPVIWNEKAIGLSTYKGSILSIDDANTASYKPIADIGTMKLLPIAIYGPHNSQRIVAQRGVFVCFGKDIRSMERLYEDEGFPSCCLTRIKIKRNKLPFIYSALQRHGITDSVVFPDLDGLAREIKREYSFEV
jgi:hypothetical protein